MIVIEWVMTFLKLCFSLLYLLSFVGIAYYVIVGSIKLAQKKNKQEFMSRLLLNLGCIVFFLIVILAGSYFYE